MSASLRTAGRTAVAARLDALALVLLAILPLGMAIANKSAQPILAGAALAAVIARARCGELGEVRARIASLLRSPVGLLALAFFAYGAISIGWSHHFKTSARAWSEVAGAVGVVLVLHAALPRDIPGWAIKLATIAIALACLLIVAELSTGMVFRANLGVRSYAFIFKRSVTAILMVGWPVAALLWISGRRGLAVALGLLFTVTAYAAHSTATALGLAAGLGAIAVVLASQRAASWAVAGAIAIGFAVAPVLGDAVGRFVPDRVIERFDFAHASERVEIWQTFGEVVKRRPVLGVGFGTSPVMDKEPVAAEIPENRRRMLIAWHTHNGYLQIWAELGLVGVLLAAGAFILTALRIGRADQTRAIVGAALMSSAAAIMLVGHGVWQGWWSTMIGAGIILLARLPRPDLRPSSDRTRVP